MYFRLWSDKLFAGWNYFTHLKIQLTAVEIFVHWAVHHYTRYWTIAFCKLAHKSSLKSMYLLIIFILCKVAEWNVYLLNKIRMLGILHILNYIVVIMIYEFKIYNTPTNKSTYLYVFVCQFHTFNYFSYFNHIISCRVGTTL